MSETKAHKPTRAEIDDRIDRTRLLIAQGNSKGDVKRALKKAYGVSAATCERYLRRARELILEETGKSSLEHRAEALAFYQQLKADPNSTPLVKLKAQERIDKLLALEMPAKVTLTDPSGELPGTIRLEAGKMLDTLPDDDLSRLAAAHDIMERLNSHRRN